LPRRTPISKSEDTQIKPDYELFERCLQRWAKLPPPKPLTPEEARELRLLFGPVRVRTDRGEDRK
jgi:hypothetical protein